MPQLLIVRHAIAQERDEAQAQQLSDADRPLTDKGRQRMRQVAAGLRAEVGPLARILSSPLLRARQSAEILAREYPGIAVSLTDNLRPGQPPASLLEELEAPAAEGTLAIVGHEPDLSTLIALLLCSSGQAAIRLKKGGAALLDFPRNPAPAEGILLWLLTPTQLRRLAADSQ